MNNLSPTWHQTTTTAASRSSQQKRSPSKLPPSPTTFGRLRSDLRARSLLSGALLEITVGPEEKRWHLHLNLLRHYSSFFDQYDGQDASNAPVDLKEEDTAAFRMFVKWLYQGRIDEVSSIPKDKKWDYAFACQNLYMLCERLGVEDLKNQAIDQFRRGCFETRLVPGSEEILPVYRRTKVGSPFRMLVSKIAARQIMDPDTKRDAVMYSQVFTAAPEFAVDVLNAIREGTNGVLLDDPTEGNGCRYHEHAGGESCCKSVHFLAGT